MMTLRRHYRLLSATTASPAPCIYYSNWYPHHAAIFRLWHTTPGLTTHSSTRCTSLKWYYMIPPPRRCCLHMPHFLVTLYPFPSLIVVIITASKRMPFSFMLDFLLPAVSLSVTLFPKEPGFFYRCRQCSVVAVFNSLCSVCFSSSFRFRHLSNSAFHSPLSFAEVHYGMSPSNDAFPADHVSARGQGVELGV